MGDILHALPAVTALRLAHPEWIIDWVVEPHWQALLAADGSVGRLPVWSPAQPLVDHLHFAATKQWRKAPFSRRTIREFNTLRRSLKSGNYDAVVDLQGAIRSALVARLAGCKRLIGEAEPRERLARRLFSERVTTKGVHVIEQDFELVSAIAGDQLAHVAPWLPIDPAAESWADEIHPESANKPAVLINPGAGWGAKRWPVERYAAVAKELIKHGCSVLINAGPGEEPLTAVIANQTGGQAKILSCTLPQLIAITRRISLAIAGDTGPLHLACALGRPVVGIYGPTDPSRNGPYGTRFVVLRSPESRRDHTRHKAPEAGLLTIQPEDVLRAANALLYPEKAPKAAGHDPAFLHTTRPAVTRLDRPLAAHCPAHSRPSGLSHCGALSFRVVRRAPQPAAVAWSLALVLPGLWLRAYASGYVKKNRELTVTGPYAHTRNPLYLGSMLMAAGFAVALLSWPVALGCSQLVLPQFISRSSPPKSASCVPHFPTSTTIAGRFRG